MFWKARVFNSKYCFNSKHFLSNRTISLYLPRFHGNSFYRGIFSSVYLIFLWEDCYIQHSVLITWGSSPVGSPVWEVWDMWPCWRKWITGDRLRGQSLMPLRVNSASCSCHHTFWVLPWLPIITHHDSYHSGTINPNKLFLSKKRKKPKKLKLKIHNDLK